MVLIDDVAESLGVSTATVSRALRGLPGVAETTRARVLKSAERMGYVPSSAASGLASGRTMAMGALLPVIDQWYFSAVLEGIDRQLRAAGYDLIVFNLGGVGANRERVFHRSILRKRIDALLVMGFGLTEEEQCSLQKLESPTMVVGGAVDGVRHVSIDDAAAVREAVEHLISLGHTRIAHIRGGGSFEIDFEVPRIRQAVYQQTMEDHGLEVRPEWSVYGDFRFSGGREAALRLLADPLTRPTAVFCSSDEMALGVLRAASELGVSVPEQLSVVGIDDHEFSEPMGLTTIQQNPEDQGSYAASLLLDELLKKVYVEKPSVQPHRLIIRQTTAKPPAGPPARQV